ncbi:hypothetical protein GQ457_02G006740 [Hibiscus cannabinus]
MSVPYISRRSLGLAKRPERRPPKTPATACVWKTPNVSSTLWKKADFRCKTIIVYHGIDPDITPIRTAAHGSTRPAHALMHTRPVIIPWTAPMTELFLYTAMSKASQTNRLVAVQTWVFITAKEVMRPAESGEPPLKPVHPSHRNPAPPKI